MNIVKTVFLFMYRDVCGCQYFKIVYQQQVISESNKS